MQVGDARHDIVLRMIGVFGRQEVFANGLLLQLPRPLLGQHMLLNSMTAIVSHPGAQQQGIHRDYPHLFDYARNLPVHAVTAVVLVIDVDLATGPTGVSLGSHLWDGNEAPDASVTVSPLERGDCMVMDYRPMHAGMPNRSGRARPMVYLTYARPWFFDQHNYLASGRNPLDMPLDGYNELPPSVRLYEAADFMRRGCGLAARCAPAAAGDAGTSTTDRLTLLRILCAHFARSEDRGDPAGAACAGSCIVRRGPDDYIHPRKRGSSIWDCRCVVIWPKPENRRPGAARLPLADGAEPLRGSGRALDGIQARSHRGRRRPHAGARLHTRRLS
jgi:hypothetical protein